ncbi:O-antigen ligase family protein [Nocardioides piscis]|uniref:O-antigen ligase family protein n=1 Tax=Nocardioides piscis TaxID=2714938 RepID=A0A6G7YEL3_9ACTN|nr:O-antigen ligase family protein [Nocardioides piscis]QIK75245.1 O-antigen ligase family protein [Nocardioides piscis]
MARAPGKTHRIRRRLLSITILLLLTASFTEQVVPSNAALTLLRFACPVGLVLVTWALPQHRRLIEAPPAARRLVASAYGLTLLALASTSWSVAPLDTITNAAAFGTLTLLLHLSICRAWRVPKDIADDVTAIAWVLGVTAVLGLIAPTFGVTNLSPYHGRYVGLFANPNALGANSALTVLLAFGSAASQPVRWKSATMLALAAVSAYSLLLSASRTAVVACLLAIIFVMVRRGAGVVVSTSLFLVPFAVVFASAYQPSTTGLLEPLFARFSDGASFDSFGNRTSTWQLTIDLWQLRPLEGYGFRSGEAVFRDSAGTNALSFEVAHSSYLQLLLELGVLGMAVAAALFFAAARGALVAPRTGVGAWLGGAVLLGLATGLTESVLFGTGQVVSWLFWICCAAACTSPIEDNPDFTSLATPSRVAG